MVHQVEKDLWLLIAEEVAKLRFPSITEKLGKFFTAIQVDVPGALDSVRTLQAIIKPLRLNYLRIQRPETPCLPGKCFLLHRYCYIGTTTIHIIIH
jgi:hypothetical protein